MKGSAVGFVLVGLVCAIIALASFGLNDSDNTFDEQATSHESETESQDPKENQDDGEDDGEAITQEAELSETDETGSAEVEDEEIPEDTEPGYIMSEPSEDPVPVEEPEDLGYVYVGVRSGWLESDTDNGDAEHIEYYWLEDEPITKVAYKVTLADSDEEHATTDEGSSPDTADVCVFSEGHSIAQQMTTGTSHTFTFESDYGQYLDEYWNVEIFGVEFGLGNPIRLGMLFVSIDAGLAWTIEAEYWYDVEWIPEGSLSDPDGVPTNVDLGIREGWLDGDDDPTHTEAYMFTGERIINVTFLVSIEEYDQEHEFNDEGTDPDTAKVTVEGDGYKQSKTIESNSSYVFEFELEEGDEHYWTVEILGLEFGDGEAIGPGGGLTVGDMGLAWTIETEYWYM